MKKIILAASMVLANFAIAVENDVEIISTESETRLFIEEHQIIMTDYPASFNPSLVKTDYGFLLSFRYLPDPVLQPTISYIGLLKLDHNLKPMERPQLIDTRTTMRKIPSRSEDARLFKFRDELYVIYNDDIYVPNPKIPQRRDMFVAKLNLVDGEYVAEPPIKLIHEERSEQHIQKNWVPFEWNENLLFGYSLAPHEIVQNDLEDSMCKVVCETYSPVPWDWGQMRGGTQAEMVDGEYLAFFHSSVDARSDVSNYKKYIHYFMGAYTFSAQPPFELTKMTQFPIFDKGFYTQSNYYKRVIFPGGFAVDGDYIYLAYGKDDCEVWIAKMSKSELFNQLKPLDSNLGLKERMRFK